MPLHTALYSGRLRVFKTLLRGPGGQVAVDTKDTKGSTPFHVACKAQPAAAVVLLEKGCPVVVDVNVTDDGGRTPLSEATHHGHAEVVKVCEERGLAVRAGVKMRERV